MIDFVAVVIEIEPHIDLDDVAEVIHE